MENIILVAVLVIIIGAAIAYIVKEKKKGTKCIGCPSAAACARKQGGCSCHTETR